MTSSMINNRRIQGRKFEGILAEASAEEASRSCSGGLWAFFLSSFFKHLAEAAASAASMQFTALRIKKVDHTYTCTVCIRTFRSRTL